MKETYLRKPLRILFAVTASFLMLMFGSFLFDWLSQGTLGSVADLIADEFTLKTKGAVVTMQASTVDFDVAMAILQNTTVEKNATAQDKEIVWEHTVILSENGMENVQLLFDDACTWVGIRTQDGATALHRVRKAEDLSGLLLAASWDLNEEAGHQPTVGGFSVIAVDRNNKTITVEWRSSNSYEPLYEAVHLAYNQKGAWHDCGVKKDAEIRLLEKQQTETGVIAIYDVSAFDLSKPGVYWLLEFGNDYWDAFSTPFIG